MEWSLGSSMAGADFGCIPELASASFYQNLRKIQCSKPN